MVIAYLIVSIDPVDLKVKAAGIFSENAASLTRLNNSILADVFEASANTYQEAQDQLLEFIATIPSHKLLLDIIQKY